MCSLIRVHSVCFHAKIQSEVHLKYKRKKTFSGQKKIVNRIKVKLKAHCSIERGDIDISSVNSLPRLALVLKTFFHQCVISYSLTLMALF